MPDEAHWDDEQRDAAIKRMMSTPPKQKASLTDEKSAQKKVGAAKRGRPPKSS